MMVVAGQAVIRTIIMDDDDPDLWLVYSGIDKWKQAFVDKVHGREWLLKACSSASSTSEDWPLNRIWTTMM